jgi:hypothetical protein
MIPLDSTAKKGKPTLPKTLPKELKKVPIYFFARFFDNLELENFKPLFVKRKNLLLRDLRKFQVLKKIWWENRKSENHKKE